MGRAWDDAIDRAFAEEVREYAGRAAKDQDSLKRFGEKVFRLVETTYGIEAIDNDNDDDDCDED